MYFVTKLLYQANIILNDATKVQNTMLQHQDHFVGDGILKSIFFVETDLCFDSIFTEVSF